MSTFVFDVEIIGKNKPVFLVCIKDIKTKITQSFWYHKKGDMKRLETLLLNPKHLWISFNGINFDVPLICAAIQGANTAWLKTVSSRIIETGMKSWQTYREYNIDFIKFNHIDLIEVTPGVMISLKTYAGRMHYPTMVDMPFDHNQDLTPKQLPILEQYCLNDLGVTEALYKTQLERIALRIKMSTEYDLDLRSKSDAQCAEAILRKRLNIRKTNVNIPHTVRYTAPAFIQTENETVEQIKISMEDITYIIDQANGAPVAPKWMEQVFKVGAGTYQTGIGGLHSTHDHNRHLVATDDILISDFDVASYYPELILKCGLGKPQFLNEYADIKNTRMLAKREGDKVKANSLKIVLNGIGGKLNSVYSAFYAPDMFLAMVLTGQLNLLCLIADLEAIKGVTVLSANTDGIMVSFPPTARTRINKVFKANIKRTGFEYEETPYSQVALKDVNNYIAIGTDDKVKIKGIYSEGCVWSPGNIAGKNPAMYVSTLLALEYLLHNTHPDKAINKFRKMKDYVAIRNVKGSGVQHTHEIEVDDWEEIEDHVWQSTSTGKTEKRKSRPKPFLVGVGGTPFGRVARWYMTKETLPPLTYLSSGNRVPKTEGAKLCMTLPARLPPDLDKAWYIQEALKILNDLGVKI